MVTTESRGLDASDKKYVYFSFTFCFRFWCWFSRLQSVTPKKNLSHQLKSSLTAPEVVLGSPSPVRNLKYIYAYFGLTIPCWSLYQKGDGFHSCQGWAYLRWRLAGFFYFEGQRQAPCTNVHPYWNIQWWWRRRHASSWTVRNFWFFSAMFSNCPAVDQRFFLQHSLLWTSVNPCLMQKKLQRPSKKVLIPRVM